MRRWHTAFTGHVYWKVLLPVDAALFPRMLTKIVQTAEAENSA